VRTTEPQRQHTEARIRAAIDRLLRGELPTGGKCDTKTLAAEAAITRASLYTTYSHLKTEFETRRDRLRDAGTIADPREARITRLNTEITTLKQRAAERDQQIATLTGLRTSAISRLAAQHDEILRLREQLARYDNVRVLHPAPAHTPPVARNPEDYPR